MPGGSWWTTGMPRISPWSVLSRHGPFYYCSSPCPSFSWIQLKGEKGKKKQNWFWVSGFTALDLMTVSSLLIGAMHTMISLNALASSHSHTLHKNKDKTSNKSWPNLCLCRTWNAGADLEIWGHHCLEGKIARLLTKEDLRSLRQGQGLKEEEMEQQKQRITKISLSHSVQQKFFSPEKWV